MTPSLPSLVIEFEAVHPSQVRSPEAVDLLRQWRLLREARPYELVSREAFEGCITPRQAGQLLILRGVDGGDDFRVHRHGSVCVAQMQFDARGQRLSDLGGELGGWMRELARQVLAARAPHRCLSVAEAGQPVATWEQLLFPIWDEQAQPWVLVYRTVAEWRHQYADAALHQLGTAALGLRARHIDRDVIGDWHVLTANPALSRLFGLGEAGLLGRPVEQALPAWRALDLAAECATVLRQGRATEVSRLWVDEHGGVRQLAVHLAPMHNGVVLGLTDVTRLLRGLVRSSALGGFDATTGLADRQAYEERLRAEVLCARRAGDGPSLLLAELDGEGAASLDQDQLRQLARVLRDACGREQDLAARLDPQRFALLLPATDLAGAQVVAARLQEGLQALSWQARDADGRSVWPAGLGLCIGIAAYHRDGDEARLQERAEQALLTAQRAGGGARTVTDARWLAVPDHPGARVNQLLPGVEVRHLALEELAELAELAESGSAAARGSATTRSEAVARAESRRGGWAGGGWSNTRHR